MEIQIQPLVSADWEAVRAIYWEGIMTGQATFEAEVPTWASWDSGHLPFARLVARTEDGTAKGWAALSPVSIRSVYNGVAEASVYISSDSRKQGIGRLLLEALIRESEANNIWTLQSSMFPENTASVSLHKACGFRVVGTRARIGKLQDAWRDTLLMERRSRRVGI